jgi:hypothetical protein
VVDIPHTVCLATGCYGGRLFGNMLRGGRSAGFSRRFPLGSWRWEASYTPTSVPPQLLALCVHNVERACAYGLQLARRVTSPVRLEALMNRGFA